MFPKPVVSPVDAVALGRTFRDRREQLGRAQDELAIAVGISRVALQNIEAGLSDRAHQRPLNPRLTTLVALCRELDGRLIIDLAQPHGVVVEFDPVADE
ncbi:helix-turn-helix transcriptional regulator [uncultured Friedmanniella sp.]|uniref:helix-turn-helix transcriptional regulator n=1 Tax=uncultured Friedmanniella sp. TaxID=335381 RepID=UPI0035C9B25A